MTTDLHETHARAVRLNRVALLAALVVAVGLLVHLRRPDPLQPAVPARTFDEAVRQFQPNAPNARPTPARPIVSHDDGRMLLELTARLADCHDDDEPEAREARIAALDRLFTDDGRRPFPGQLALLEAIAPPWRDFAFGLPCFQHWRESQPQAALDWIRDHPDISDARVLTLLQQWSDRDAKGVRAYLDELPAGRWKQTALTAGVHAALAGDPGEAVRRATLLAAGDQRTALLTLSATHWARSDPVSAAGWVNSVADQELKRPLLAAIAIGYAETDPALAVTWLASAMPPGTTLDHAASEIAGIWARSDPARAASWIAQFPGGEPRSRAAAVLLNEWLRRDRAAAIAWVHSLADPEFRSEVSHSIRE